MPHPKGWTERQEIEFQYWYNQWASTLGLDLNPDDPKHYYDWRAAYLADASPDESGHWPSKFKLKGHPRYHLR